jgi:hypothetical protein
MKKAGDFGRSRYRVYNGETVDKFGSKYLEIDVNAKVSEDGLNKDGDFIIEMAPWGNIQGRRFTKGDMMRFHKGVTQQADNQEAKSRQDATFVNIIHMLTVDMNKAVAEASEDEGIELGVCIPAGEYFSENGIDEMKDNLAGPYRIKFPALDTELCFNIDRESIRVAGEGVIALATLMNNPEKWEIVTSGLGAIIDAGFGSLDITLLENGRPVGNGARSFPIGGITLESKLESELEGNNIFVSHTNVQTAIVSGSVSQGKKSLPVGEYVRNVKHEVAKMFLDSLKKVLIDAGRGEGEIQYFFKLGRCFKDNRKDILGEKVYTELEVDEIIDLESNENYTGSISDYMVEDWKYEIDVLEPELPEGFDSMEDANAYGLGMGMFRKEA